MEKRDSLLTIKMLNLCVVVFFSKYCILLDDRFPEKTDGNLRDRR